MRDHDRSFHTGDLRCREICHITFHCSGNQCVYHILAVHKGIAGKIQDHNILFHQTDGVFIDHPDGILQRRHMDRNIITLSVQFINRLCVMDIPGQSPCGINGYIGVIPIYIHSKMYGGICHEHSDRAKSDNSELLAQKFCPGESLFTLLRQFCKITVLFMFLYPVDTSDDIPCREKHAGDHQFLYPVRICAGSIKYDNPVLSAAVQRNIVHSRTGTSNRLQVRTELHIMHFRASDKNDVRIICFFCVHIVFI